MYTNTHTHVYILYLSVSTVEFASEDKFNRNFMRRGPGLSQRTEKQRSAITVTVLLILGVLRRDVRGRGETKTTQNTGTMVTLNRVSEKFTRGFFLDIILFSVNRLCDIFSK